MARKGGNPNINEINKGTRFNKESAVIAAKKKAEKERAKKSIFAAIRPYSEEIIPKDKIPEGVLAFWESRGVGAENISAMLIDMTPMLANAIKGGDYPTYFAIMKQLGMTFESTREQNVKVAFENTLETNVNGEITINIVEKKPEPIDDE